jgi:hypothetical protein
MSSNGTASNQRLKRSVTDGVARSAPGAYFVRTRVAAVGLDPWKRVRTHLDGGTATRLTAAMCTIALLASAGPAATSTETPEAAAESAALAWLKLVDGGNYAASWSSASSLFRQKVSEAQWESAAANARAPLAALTSRKVQSATPKGALPGAPDGEYMIVQFASSFEHKGVAIETVTPVKDSDGKWHVSGYYIK